MSALNAIEMSAFCVELKRSFLPAARRTCGEYLRGERADGDGSSGAGSIEGFVRKINRVSSFFQVVFAVGRAGEGTS